MRALQASGPSIAITQPRVPIGGTARVVPPAKWAAVAAASTLVHCAVITALVWNPSPGPEDPPSQQASVQVEYVSQDATIKGVAAPDPTAAPDPDAVGGAAPAIATPPPPPSDPFADVPMPPEVPRSDSAAIHSGRPAVNLGDADDEHDALTVTGDNVVSSGPDAKYVNMPPSYPHEAVRRHQQGSVQVLVHVTPQGDAGGVDMITSSGSPALDNAALAAVMKWHFKPAIRDGVPVASVYPLQMNFRSGP
jgi:protein TonB